MNQYKVIFRLSSDSEHGFHTETHTGDGYMENLNYTEFFIVKEGQPLHSRVVTGSVFTNNVVSIKKLI